MKKKKEIELNAWQKLIEHKVTIETKQDNFKTYLILLSTDREYLIFSQSTDKTLEELEKILKTLGKGQGLTSYDEFYNTFYTLPKNMVDDDFFIGFTIDRLDWGYAVQKGYTQWSKLYVGHWTAKGYFYSSKKGIWTYGIFEKSREFANYVKCGVIYRYNSPYYSDLSSFIIVITEYYSRARKIRPNRAMLTSSRKVICLDFDKGHRYS